MERPWSHPDWPTRREWGLLGALFLCLHGGICLLLVFLMCRTFGCEYLDWPAPLFAPFAIEFVPWVAIVLWVRDRRQR
jgi:hypothetical protein